MHILYNIITLNKKKEICIEKLTIRNRSSFCFKNDWKKLPRNNSRSKSRQERKVQMCFHFPFSLFTLTLNGCHCILETINSRIFVHKSKSKYIICAMKSKKWRLNLVWNSSKTKDKKNRNNQYCTRGKTSSLLYNSTVQEEPSCTWGGSPN